MRLSCLSLGMFVLFCWSVPGHAVDLELTVNSFLDVPDDNPGDGLCRPVNAVGNTCTLRAAIMEANANAGAHSIFLPGGTYQLTRTGILEDQALTGDLDIRQTIRVFSADDDRALINGRNIDRVFDVHSGGTLILRSVNVIGGFADEVDNVAGGAVRVAYGGALSLFLVDISNNVANVGGGIYSDGWVNIDRSRLFNNALRGGQLTPEFRTGTAIRSRGKLMIGRSTFDQNGLIPGGTGLLTGRRVIQSSADGLEPAPSLTIWNSTFHGNTGGIRSEKVHTSIAASTLSANGLRGVSFVVDDSQLGVEQLRIVRTVLFGHDRDCNDLPSSAEAAWISSTIFNASSDASCGFSGVNGFENISNPFNGGLADHGGGTLTLMPKSFGVLVDPAGSDCQDLVPSFNDLDQRNFPRPLDGNGDGTALCDIGAVEFNRDTDPVLSDGLFSDRFEQ